MSVAVVYSRASLGMKAPLVEVEVHLSSGLPAFAMVGLPEAVVKESKERVRSAIINSQFEFPSRRITVNLAPADLPKEDGRYDLAIAVGILAASQQIPGHALLAYEFGGELGLSGELRSFPGVLPMIMAARLAQRALILPVDLAYEGWGVSEVEIFSAPHLLSVCQHLCGTLLLRKPTARDLPARPLDVLDLADICGQYQAKRALEIAAAGGHSLLLCGPPGSGKTLLAHRLVGILPPITTEQALEIAAIYSLRGSCTFSHFNEYQRPFRAPHHSASSIALVGGGRKVAPGEVSLAHHGVLFLDELPEFSRASLEGLREPLEARSITIARASYTAEYPAHFQLIAAMNPCPCGYWQDGSSRCLCTIDQVRRYQKRISGPFMDRIDLFVKTSVVGMDQLVGHRPEQTTQSHEVRQRVMKARERQLLRMGSLNAEMSSSALAQHCVLTQAEALGLQEALQRLGFSARGYHRLLKVARTIADLAEENTIGASHWQEALTLKKAGP